MPTSPTQPSNQIGHLNDAFRNGGFTSGQWVMTRGIADQGPDFIARAVRAVRSFEAFTPDNDPNGEHDFGAVVIDGQRLFWKIDCYDQNLEFGSEDPADPTITKRVMTVMLASEY